MMKTMKRLWLTAVLTLCVGASASAYSLTVGNSAHGTVGFSVGSTSVTTAEAGDVVTITVTPAEGYAVESVTARAFTTWGKAQPRRRAPGLTKDLEVTLVGTDWTLTMPAADVEVSVVYKSVRLQCDVDAEDTESGRDVSGVTLTLTVTDDASGTVTVDGIVVPSGVSGDPLTIHIPATAAGYEVTAIAAGAIPAGSNVSDIYLPATEHPLSIGENALPATATIHTPLSLLDDYALTASLRMNYEAGKVMTTVVAPNDCWTLSSGVDIALPAGLIPYTAYRDGTSVRIVPIGEDDLVLSGGRRGIKGNNGVLLIGRRRVSYDLTAIAGRQMSGTVPSTADAGSYGTGNQLEPVIESRHYAPGDCLVLKDNQFHGISDSQSKVPSCRAVLRMK